MLIKLDFQLTKDKDHYKFGEKYGKEFLKNYYYILEEKQYIENIDDNNMKTLKNGINELFIKMTKYYKKLMFVKLKLKIKKEETKMLLFLWYNILIHISPTFYASPFTIAVYKNHSLRISKGNMTITLINPRRLKLYLYWGKRANMMSWDYKEIFFNAPPHKEKISYESYINKEIRCRKNNHKTFPYCSGENCDKECYHNNHHLFRSFSMNCCTIMNCTNQNCIEEKFNDNVFKLNPYNFYNIYIDKCHVDDYSGNFQSVKCFRYPINDKEGKIFAKYYSIYSYLINMKFNNNKMEKLIAYNFAEYGIIKKFSQSMKKYLNKKYMFKVNINLPINVILLQLFDNKILCLKDKNKNKLIKIIYVMKCYYEYKLCINVIINKILYNRH